MATVKKAKAGVPSPSTRREWIEIGHRFQGAESDFVSLHTEGVD